MDPHLDRFSDVAAGYSQFRPGYPDDVYTHILKHVKSFNQAWDAGTGNGQVARVLADHFTQVIATDVSASQLARAANIENITYLNTRSEATGIATGTIDLITVAQALHWFDISGFTSEVQRVSADNAILAVWGYDLLRAGDEIDALTDYLHSDILDGYWDPHRFLIDTHYESISFPFHELPQQEFEMQHTRDADSLIGYLRSWSAVSKYKQRHAKDPVLEIEQRLRDAMEGEAVLCRTPVFLRMWEIDKGMVSH